MPDNNQTSPKSLAEDYWCFVQNTLIALDDQPVHFSFYSLNAERLRLHTQMAEALGLTEAETKDITDHMDECDDFEAFWEKLLALKAKKEAALEEAH